jgi:urease accessory protein
LKAPELMSASLQLVSGPLASADVSLPEIALRVERQTLAKRLWRGHADDQVEFGFELSAPLKDGEAFWQTPVARYVIRQHPEPVVEISLEVAPSAAAGIGWAIGNLHLELAAESTRLLAPDEPAVRQLLDRLKVPFRSTTAVFRPGHFVRGPKSAHELGPSHQH